MALPPWSPYLPKAQAACPQWQDPVEARQGAASQVCRLPIWHDDKASLARQGNQGRPRSLCCNQTWRVRLSQSNDINGGGILCTIERRTHQEALQMCHRLCRPLQPPPIRPPPACQWIRRNTRHQACPRAVRGRTRSQNPTLPLQQWTLPRQRLPTSMPRSKATTHLLWGKCPLPKRHCQASHPRPLGKRTEATAPCTCPLAGDSPLCTVAICLAKYSLPSQQPTSAERWHIQVGAFQLNLSRQQSEACAHFWLPSVCFTERASIRESNAKMVRTWAKFGAKSYPC